MPFRQAQIVSHADLVAITKNRSAWQRKHKTVCQLKPAAVPLEHWSKATPDAPVVELHIFIRAESVEDSLALQTGEPAQIKLVVIA